MKTHKFNRVKQTFGFFSMTVAWTLMNFIHSIYTAWTDGKADDSGVIIFWSGLFITIAWAVFIVFPVNRLDHTRQIFKPYIFPFITAIYAMLTYSLIVGGLFRSLDLVIMFMPLALLTGFIFGFSYSQLIRSAKLIDFLFARPILKGFFFLSPLFILLFFLWFLPTVAPSSVFRYMPDEIREKIVARTIPRYKVGDDFEPLKISLPGYFEHFNNGKGSMAATMGNFAFVLQVNCYKIIRLGCGNDQNEFDGTIYGKLEEENCQ